MQEHLWQLLPNYLKIYRKWLLWIVENYKTTFCRKNKFAVSINLKEKKKIVRNQNEVANIFDDYLSKVVSFL